MSPSTAKEPSISNMLSDSDIPFASLVSGSEEESMRLIAILKSRTALESIINKFNLIEYYKSKNIEDALEQLKGYTSIEITDEGTISIEVNVETDWFHLEGDEIYARELSADIVNQFVIELDRINKILQIEQAAHQRKFLGERFSKNLDDLISAEDNLASYKKNHNIISIEDQKKSAIESAAAIKNQIMIKEVQIEVVSSKLQSDHPDAISMQDELNELKKKLHEIQYGPGGDSGSSNKLFLVLSEVPDMETELRHLNREAEVFNTLFIYLTQQYEDAKIQEAKNTPTIQLLDPAIAPINKSAPKRFLMLAVMVLICFIATTIYSLADYRKDN
jgi:uncharacterized protein involved in exopolysaccharide biosynthesis